MVDVLEWKYRKVFHPRKFNLVCASPPCEEYSAAKTVGIRNLQRADAIVIKTIEIIRYLNRPAWWIENPRLGMLRNRPFMQNIPYIDVDYCQFSEWGYQKPTRFWCSKQIATLPNCLCDGINCTNLVNTPNGTKHRESLGGEHMGLAQP